MHAQHAPAHMAHQVLDFNEQIERIGEVAAVIAIGALLAALPWQEVSGWLLALVLLVARPLAVMVGLGGSDTSRLQRRLISWFGIRGVGSVYYLMFAISHGLPDALARQLSALTLSVVAASILLHGVSVTPLMRRYQGKA